MATLLWWTWELKGAASKAFNKAPSCWSTLPPATDAYLSSGLPPNTRWTQRTCTSPSLWKQEHMGDQSVHVNTDAAHCTLTHRLTEPESNDCSNVSHRVNVAPLSSWSRHTLLWAALCSWFWWLGGFSCLCPGAVRKRGVINMQLTAPLEWLDLPLITFSCSASSVLGDPYQFTQILHRARAWVKTTTKKEKRPCVTPVYTEKRILRSQSHPGLWNKRVMSEMKNVLCQQTVLHLSVFEHVSEIAQSTPLHMARPITDTGAAGLMQS